MLLKSLKLSNFRQFRNEEINFSVDKERNVTIIIGENGTGKTTFAQAFFWCLYGETDFKDKSMLNKIVAADMTPNNDAIVKVSLSLIHAEVEYQIVREQIYKKDYSNNVRALNSTLSIQYKWNGQQEYLKPLENEPRIRSILPKELSKYFFFDGERIEKMSKEIQSGRKSSDFADAVRGLLGLDAFIAAKDHLKPTSKYGVIGSYENSYDSKSDSNILKYTQDIEKYQNELEKIENRLSEIDIEIEKASERKADLTKKIRQYAEGEKLQKEKESLLKKLLAAQNLRKRTVETMLSQFNNNASAYFSRSMIKKALEELKNEDFTNKDIPEMHAKTIDFLIKKGSCICGTPLEAGSDAYNNIINLLNYLPPQSIGISVGQFVKESQIRAKSSANLFNMISSTMSVIRGQENDIDEILSNISLIDKNFKGEDVSKIVQSYHKEIQICEKVIQESRNESINLVEQRGSINTKKERAITERSALTLRDESNRKIEIYKAYAQYMYDELQKAYSENENKTRKKLEETINEIFKNIYNGGMSLTIDEKYNISVFADDFDGFNNIETSTAQSISVIFAFISGIIKMARESNADNNEDSKLLASEPYPLVMDAPLSAFDKRRIETICSALPVIAEQVIIFIKDTDGDIAEEHLGVKVGSRHKFDKINEFETKLIVR